MEAWKTTNIYPNLMLKCLEVSLIEKVIASHAAIVVAMVSQADC